MTRSVLGAFIALAILAAPVLAAEQPATLEYISIIRTADTSASVPASGSTESLIWQPLANVIDQNQPSNTAYIAAFSQTCLAQSFKQTNSTITGAGIFLQAGVGSSDNVTIQLYTLLPNAGGVMLAQASATGTAGQWVDVYWSDVPNTGITYYLVFTGNSTLGIGGSTSNPYPNGQCYANPGYGSWPNFDYAFRTYYNDAASLERATWASVKALFE